MYCQNSFRRDYRILWRLRRVLFCVCVVKMNDVDGDSSYSFSLFDISFNTGALRCISGDFRFAVLDCGANLVNAVNLRRICKKSNLSEDSISTQR